MQFANSRLSVSMRRTASAWPMALVLGLGACGYQGQDTSSSTKAESLSSLVSFDSWCESWSILCTTEPSPDSTPIKLDSQTWTAVTNVANEALNNPISFSVTRTEIDSPKLSLAFEKLGLSDDFNEFKAKLDNAHWESLALESKSLVSRASDVGTVSSANGLSFSSQTTLALSIASDASVNISGFGIASEAAGKSADLKSVSLGANNTLNFGLTDETVENVPFPFLEKTLLSALGIEDTVSEPVDISLAQISQAAYPILSWANQPQRTVALNRKFFATAGTELKPLLAQESFGPAILNALSALDSLAISATQGKNVATIKQVSGAKLECNVNNGTAKLMLDKEFGLKRYYEVDGGIGLEFYGVRATAKAALGIPLTVKRLELRGSKLTVLDVPLIGKIEVDLDTLGGEDTGSSTETVIACVK